MFGLLTYHVAVDFLVLSFRVGTVSRVRRQQRRTCEYIYIYLFILTCAVTHPPRTPARKYFNRVAETLLPHTDRKCIHFFVCSSCLCRAEDLFALYHHRFCLRLRVLRFYTFSGLRRGACVFFSLFFSSSHHSNALCLANQPKKSRIKRISENNNSDGMRRYPYTQPSAHTHTQDFVWCFFFLVFPPRNRVP